MPTILYIAILSIDGKPYGLWFITYNYVNYILTVGSETAETTVFY